MDKRKLRLKTTLHKNLSCSSSQASASNSTDEDNLTNKELTSRKRKLPILDITKSKSRNDSNLCLSQNEITKRRRNEVNLTQEINKLSQYENYSKINDIMSQKITSSICKTPLKTKETSIVSERNNDNIIETEKSRNIQENISNIQTTEKTKLFIDYLKKCGITLASDEAYIFNQEVTTIKQKMKEKLQSKEYKKQEIINSLEEYIDNGQNLQSILFDFVVSSDCQSFDHISNTCIVRILLQISELQPDIYVCFLNKLNESVLLV